ncbi:hypothetical protein D3C86_1425680 [compost metagenome]
MPSPCVGDGEGHPCTIESCVCEASCSCTFACDSAAERRGHATCHMGAAMPAEHDRDVAHSTMPKLQPPTLLAADLAFRPLRPEAYRPLPEVRAAYYPPILSIASPPPRITG